MAKAPIENAPLEVKVEAEPPRLGKVKLAFMYVLIAGLVASAITAVIALLIGEFNASIQKALLTIFIFFTHSLFILGLILADKHNHIGKALLPTTIGILALANMITTTLGTWDIITTEKAWHIFGFYFLVLGTVFIIMAILRLKVVNTIIKNLVIASAAFTALLAAVLAPWVLHVVDSFDPFYYRVVGAVAIVATTLFLITLIFRGIALARHPQLKVTPVSEPIPGGLLAIYITLGVITAMVWSTAFTSFLVDAIQSGHSDTPRGGSSQQNKV